MQKTCSQCVYLLRALEGMNMQETLAPLLQIPLGTGMPAAPLSSGTGAPPRPNAGLDPEEHPAAGAKLRVLVVDDVSDVADMMAMFLKFAGYEPVVVNSGPAALDAARSELFNVVVSDIGMPGMDGYELAGGLRGLPGYDGIPLIAITGYSMYNDKRRSREAGFDAHLTKPVNPKQLIETIRKLSD